MSHQHPLDGLRVKSRQTVLVRTPQGQDIEVSGVIREIRALNTTFNMLEAGDILYRATVLRRIGGEP